MVTMTVVSKPSMLHTERLRLRPRTLADLDASLAMDLDPQVHRYIFAKTPDPDHWRARITAQITSGWPPIGGLWAVERQDEPGFLGWCGLFPLEHSGLIEIGYRYVPAAWGQGIGSEAARRCSSMAFAPSRSIRSWRSPIRRIAARSGCWRRLACSRPARRTTTGSGCAFTGLAERNTSPHERPIGEATGNGRYRSASASLAPSATKAAANVRRIQVSTRGREMTWLRIEAANSP
jgi:RimJ/RimL family protein N-acetyltransferase